MTILTKPSLIIKKEEVSEAPLVHENLCDEEKIDIHPPGVAWVGKRPSGGLMCLSLTALLMASVGIICGLLLYRQYLHTTPHRYQGFCTIPIDARQEAQIRWHTMPDGPIFSEYFVNKKNVDNNKNNDNNGNNDYNNNNNNNNNNNINIINNDNDDVATTEDSLVERMDIGDFYEKVVVIDNDRSFEFIHDFTANLTAIVEDGRCFMMTLDPSIVLPPEQLITGIEAGQPFDISRVRTFLRADLNAPKPNLMSAAFLLMDACMDKPTYMLKMDDSAFVRKRSAEEPSREFIQFSGKHVQEIEIGNMAEVLRFEKEGRSPGAESAAQAAP